MGAVGFISKTVQADIQTLAMVSWAAPHERQFPSEVQLLHEMSDIISNFDFILDLI